MRRLLLFGVATTVAVALAVGQASGGGNTVKAVNFDFKPKRIAVEKGEKVTWKNAEGKHTVTAKMGKFDKVIKGDERVSHTFKKEGTWRYICRFHVDLGMKGKVIVG